MSGRDEADEHEADEEEADRGTCLDGGELRRAHGHVGALEQAGDALEVRGAAERALTAPDQEVAQGEPCAAFSRRATPMRSAVV